MKNISQYNPLYFFFCSIGKIFTKIMRQSNKKKLVFRILEGLLWFGKDFY